MTALQTALKSTLVAAAAALALTACDRGTNEDAGTTTGSTDSRPADAPPGGMTAPGTSGDTSSTGSTTGSAADSSGTAGTTTGSTAGTTTDSPTGATAGGSTTGSASTSASTGTGTDMAQSPESTMNADPPAAGSTGSGPSTAALAAADRKFVETAASAGLYEVAVAKLAADKATDPAVKSYASMLVDHHTAANDKLKQVASSRNVELPSTMPADKQKVIEKLSKAEGAAFDREFVQTVGIKDHRSDIALFEKASKNAKDPEIKSFAESTLPTLREHLTQARKLPATKG